MSERSFHELGGVLAAPPPRARRLWLAAAAVALAIALTAVGVVIATQPPAGLLAILSGPGGQQEYSAAFSPDGKTLAVVDDGGISLWDVATRRWTTTLTGPGCQQDSVPVVYSPDGKTLAKFSDTDKTCLWNLATGQETTLTDPCPATSSSGMDGVFSPDGTTLAVAGCSPGGAIYLWDLATRRLTAILTDPAPGIASLAFGPDHMLAVGDDGPDETIYLWDLATRRLTATLNNPGQDGIASLDFSADGMLAVGDDVSLYLWNVATRKLTATIQLSYSQAAIQAYLANHELSGTVLDPSDASAVFNPDGQMLAANVDFGYGTYLYNVATGKLLATLTDPGTDSADPPDVVFSPHGSMLAVVDGNGRTYLWHAG